MASVRFENITFHYGDNCVLDHVSLTVDESQIMCLVGPSGCGKTTLIRCLLGFNKPETGSIYIGDKCVYSAEKRINIAPEKRGIGVVFQDYAVWPHLTVMENVIYPLKKRKLPKDEQQRRAMHALKQVRMENYGKHLPAQLSGGQQQRVAIARALVSSDDLIVLDEPITNLDAKLREEMLYEIRNIQKEIGTTIFYITHDQAAALKLCDQMAVMNQKGKIVQIGKDEDIILRPEDRFVFEFIGVSNFLPIEKHDGKWGFKLDRFYPCAQLDSMKIDGSSAKEMGVRPNDIIFDPASPLKARIVRAVFLGSEYDYFLDFGGVELRAQASALDILEHGEAKEGDTVGISFANPRIYERKDS